MALQVRVTLAIEFTAASPAGDEGVANIRVRSLSAAIKHALEDTNPQVGAPTGVVRNSTQVRILDVEPDSVKALVAP